MLTRNYENPPERVRLWQRRPRPNGGRDARATSAAVVARGRKVDTLNERIGRSWCEKITFAALAVAERRPAKGNGITNEHTNTHSFYF